MKASFNFLISMFFAISVYASPFAGSVLELSVKDYGNFIFVVNGTTYQAYNGNIRLEGVKEGVYDVQIYRLQRINRGYGHSYNKVFMCGDVIKVPCHTAVSAVFGKYGVRVDQQLIPNPPCYHGRKPVRGPVHCQVIGMDLNAHAALIASLSNSAFDNTKINIVKAALAGNQMTTAQIAAILRTFTFDHYRLDVAKLAYASCVDPQNYFGLTNEFTFESNSREFVKFIS